MNVLALLAAPHSPATMFFLPSLPSSCLGLKKNYLRAKAFLWHESSFPQLGRISECVDNAVRARGLTAGGGTLKSVQWMSSGESLLDLYDSLECGANKKFIRPQKIRNSNVTQYLEPTRPAPAIQLKLNPVSNPSLSSSKSSLDSTSSEDHFPRNSPITINRSKSYLSNLNVTTNLAPSYPNACEIQWLPAQDATCTAFASWISDWLHTTINGKGSERFWVTGRRANLSTNIRYQSALQICAFINASKLEIHTCILALWYISRLSLDIQEAPNVTTIQFRIFVIGSIIARKWLDDQPYSMQYWQRASSLPICLLESSEMAAMKALNWNIAMNTRRWQGWLVSLQIYHKSLARLQPICRPSENAHLLVEKLLEEAGSCTASRPVTLPAATRKLSGDDWSFKQPLRKEPAASVWCPEEDEVVRPISKTNGATMNAPWQLPWGIETSNLGVSTRPRAASLKHLRCLEDLIYSIDLRIVSA